MYFYPHNYLHYPTPKKSFPFIFILLLIQIRLYSTSSCITQDNFNREECFNDIIKFGHKKFRAGQIVTNKNNVTVIMFSDDSPGDTRLFYTLNEEGRGFYYDNETIIREISLSSDQYINND